VDHILAIHGPNPASLWDHVTLYRRLMAGPSPLSRTRREMLAVVTSRANDCHY
jgi:alkylhydroperoxidase family enzyme